MKGSKGKERGYKEGSKNIRRNPNGTIIIIIIIIAFKLHSQWNKSTVDGLSVRSGFTSWFHLIHVASTDAFEGRNRSRCEQLTVRSAAVAAVWCYHWGQQQQDFFNISHFQGRPAPTAYITQETDVGNTQSSLPLCLPLSVSLFSHFLNCVFLLVAPKNCHRGFLTSVVHAAPSLIEATEHCSDIDTFNRIYLF